MITALVAMLYVQPYILPASRPMLDLSVGVGAISRHLSYNQDVYGRFGPYTLAVAPMLTARAEVYPLAGTWITFARDLGVIVEGDYALGVSSQTADGRVRATSFWRVGAGLRWRYVFTRGQLGVSARWSMDNFSIDAVADASAPIVPSVRYQSVRPAVDFRYSPAERLSLLASVGWRFVFDTGELSDVYFSRATAQAADLELGVGVMVSATLEARATLGATRYFHAMNPQPGDRYVLGGALDHVFTGGLTLAWRR